LKLGEYELDNEEELIETVAQTWNASVFLFFFHAKHGEIGEKESDYKSFYFKN